LGALCLAGCGSSSGGGGTSEDPGGNELNTDNLNPYGIAYPTDNLGNQKRQDTIAGSRMRNYKFAQGFRFPASTGETAQTPQPVKLADFYDPHGESKYKLIHLVVSAVWCNPCNVETEELQDVSEGELAKGVVTIQFLNEDMNHNPAKLTDLEGWIQKHGIDSFNQVLDPNNAFGAFFDQAAIPWNAYLDARTMEILDSYQGGPPNGIVAEDDKWLSWYNTHEPSYPMP
jgi:hypothetical protein